MAAGGVSQADFQETPYVDQSWEIVGEAPHNEEFEPMAIETLGSTELRTDPMFSDYGGLPAAPATRRYHLPENLSGQVVGRSRAEAEAEERAEEHRVALAAAEEREAAAYERGRAEAAAAAAGEHQQQIGELTARMETLIQDFQAQVRQDSAQLERQAVELAVAIAGKIMQGAVEINPEYITTVVNEALALAKGAAVRKVRVSPEDMEFIEVVGIVQHLRNFDGSWQFERDETIKAGCVVETSAGEIDYQLDHAWERIRDSVLKAAG